MLGHKTAGITETYAKFAPDYLSQAARAVDDYFGDLDALTRRVIVQPKVLRVNSVSENGGAGRNRTDDLYNAIVRTVASALFRTCRQLPILQQIRTLTIPVAFRQVPLS